MAPGGLQRPATPLSTAVGASAPPAFSVLDTGAHSAATPPLMSRLDASCPRLPWSPPAQIPVQFLLKVPPSPFCRLAADGSFPLSPLSPAAASSVPAGTCSPPRPRLQELKLTEQEGRMAAHRACPLARRPSPQSHVAPGFCLQLRELIGLSGGSCKLRYDDSRCAVDVRVLLVLLI